MDQFAKLLADQIRLGVPTQIKTEEEVFNYSGSFEEAMLAKNISDLLHQQGFAENEEFTAEEAAVYDGLCISDIAIDDLKNHTPAELESWLRAYAMMVVEDTALGL